MGTDRKPDPIMGQFMSKDQQVGGTILPWLLRLKLVTDGAPFLLVRIYETHSAVQPEQRLV